jgi:hypothetical protein
MLLDAIRINSETELKNAIRLLLDHSAVGLELIMRERMAEFQIAAGREISTILLEQCRYSPQQAWDAVIAILRSLPWNVDPEDSKACTKGDIAAAIYRHFGGLECTAMDRVFERMREMAEEGSSWGDIVNYGCQAIEVKV